MQISELICCGSFLLSELCHTASSCVSVHQPKCSVQQDWYVLLGIPSPLDHGLKYDSRQKTRTISPPQPPLCLSLFSYGSHSAILACHVFESSCFIYFGRLSGCFGGKASPLCYRIVVRCGSQELTEGKKLSKGSR